jgi:hypothetical protein
MKKILTDAAAVGNAAGRVLNPDISHYCRMIERI